MEKKIEMKEKVNLPFLLVITMVSAMGGLLFGYDWVVIGGAKPFYEAFFKITNATGVQGWVMSSALVGCLVGALFSGTLSDRYGRKKLLIISAILFSLSALGTGAASSISMFVIYRILGGLGIGMASVLSPIYIAEIAPAHLRGRFVAINQLTIVIGILLAQVINFLIAKPVPAGFTDTMILDSWNGQMGWRYMFWAELLFSVTFLIMAIFIPESPRWLYKAGKGLRARRIITRVGGVDYAAETERNIQETLHNDAAKVDFKDLKKPGLRRIIFIGATIAILQQWCGINTVFNYADEIFTAAGYGVSEMLLNVVLVGSVNLVFTLVAMRLIDRIGRRFLMLLGYGGLTVIFAFFGGFYQAGLTGIVMLISVMMATALYAMTLAPTTWVVLSEIFPNRVRGVAMSIATFALWSACFLLTYTFPALNEGLGASGTFWLYGGICLLGFFFIRKYLVETKGKSLEEIESGYVLHNESN